MASANFKLEGNSPTVTWADPKITPDHSAAAAQVSNHISLIIEYELLKDLKRVLLICFLIFGCFLKTVMSRA